MTPKTTRRASTPLLDAIGRGINDLEQSIAQLAEDDRPARVAMVVITDGQDNSSCKFTKSQIFKMIEDKTFGQQWQFVFLSAELDAIHDAVSTGIHPGAVLLFAKNARGTGGAWSALSMRTSDYRAARKKTVGFKPDNRQHPEDPGEKKA